MTSYSKDRLSLSHQPIAGPKSWIYTDTGVVTDITDVVGFFANAGDMGMDSGDFVEVRASNGATTRVVYGAAVNNVLDTGTTQGTVGVATLIGDT